MATYGLIELDENSPTFWEEMGAAFKGSWMETPTMAKSQTDEMRRAKYPEMKYVDVSMAHLGGVVIPADQPAPANPLTKEQWEVSPYYRKELSFDKMSDSNGVVNDTVAKVLSERKDAELAINDVLSRSPGGALRTTSRFVAMFAAQMLDPINFASSFLPVIGEERYANMMLKLGKLGRLGKKSVKVLSNKYIETAVKGAIDGAVGNALMEPMIFKAAYESQRDYGVEDAALNITFGGLLGGGMHVGGKVFSDVIGKVFKHSPDDVAVIINDAIKQIEETGDFNTSRAIAMIDAMAPIKQEPNMPKGVMQYDDNGNITDVVYDQPSVQEWRESNIVDVSTFSPVETWKPKIEKILDDADKPLAGDIVKLMNGEQIDTVGTLVKIKNIPEIKKILDVSAEDVDFGADLRRIFKDVLRSDEETLRISKEVTEAVKEIAKKDPIVWAAEGPMKPKGADVEGDIDDTTYMRGDADDIDVEHPMFVDEDGNVVDLGPVNVEGRGDITLLEDTVEFPDGSQGVVNIPQENAYGLEAPPKIEGDTTIPQKTPAPGDATSSDLYTFTPHDPEDNIRKMAYDIGNVRQIINNKGYKFPQNMYGRKVTALHNEETMRNKVLSEYIEVGGNGQVIVDKYKNLPKEGEYAIDNTLIYEVVTALERRKISHPAESIVENVKAIGLEYKEHQVANLRAFTYSILKKLEVIDFIKNFVGTTAKAEKTRYSEYEALRALLQGVIQNKRGAGMSIDYLAKAHGNDFHGHLAQDLLTETAGDTIPKGSLYKIAMEEDTQLTKDISVELYNKGLSPDKQIDTGNNIAKTLATIYDKYQMAALRRMNALGAYIKAMPGYIVKQTHNRIKMQDAGFDKWFKDVKDLIDIKKTFGANIMDADLENGLRNIYSDIIVGRYQEAMFDPSPMFNDFITKKVSSSRELFFKDADSWCKYNDTYGNKKTINESVLDGLAQSGKNIAILEKLGPDPKSNLDGIINESINQIKMDKLPDKEFRFKEINDNKVTLHAMLDTITGVGSFPVNMKMSNISNNIRKWINMCRLHSAAISSLADAPAASSELTYNGMKWVDSWVGKFKYLFNEFADSADQERFARLVGIGLESMNADLINRFSATDVTGRLDKAQKWFFKWNLLQGWTDGMKRATALQLSSFLGTSLKEMDYATLLTKNIDLAKALERYGIGELEWYVISKANLETENNFFMPDSIKDIPKEYVYNMLKKKYPKGGKINSKLMVETKIDLENKIRTYYLDRVDSAVATPGSAERRMTYGDTRPGTAIGEALRFGMQFKTYPITYTRKILGREKNLQISNRAWHTTAHLALPALAMAGVVGWIKDLLGGKEFRDYTDKRNWLGLVGHSGIGGIYGDISFGTQKGYATGPLQSVAGPGIDTANDIFSIGVDMRDTLFSDKKFGKNTKFMKHTWDITESYIPFKDMFYWKLISDQLIFNSIDEALDPGVSRRKEKSLKKRTGQKYREGLGPTDRFRTFD